LTPLKVTLELRIEEDSLTGRAIDSNGSVREFTGWLGLLGALDAIARQPSSTGGAERRARQ
jgi:hypothetical protein